MSGRDPGRRDFLRQLATLPLIGGGVTLIGNPTAVAEPANEDTMGFYAQWLFFERRMVCAELANSNAGLAVRLENSCYHDRFARPDFHFPSDGRSWRQVPKPSARAAVVMSAAGFDWREGRS